MTPLERFMAKVRVEDDALDPCWIWIGKLNVYGVPIFWLDGKWVMARRFIHELATEQPFPPDKRATVPCECRSCVNPDHIVVATRSRAMRMSLARGTVLHTAVSRAKAAQALRAQSRWTWDQVRELWRLVDEGMPVMRAAARTGISQGAAYQIARNVTWREPRSGLAAIAMNAGML